MTPTPKRKVLLVSTIWPSPQGTGSGLRGFAVLRMLAARHDVYLAVVDLFGQTPPRADPLVERACRAIKHLEVAGTPAANDDPARIVQSGGLSRMAAEQAIGKFYQDNGIDLLFVFRLQSVYVLAGSLLRYPHRYLDLDELPSQAEAKIRQIRMKAGHPEPEPEELAKWEGLKKMEKLFVPKFQRVFVASEIEISRVREHTGISHAELLPNICAHRPFLPYQPIEDTQEILFVGNLSYFPNVDAVHYFCAEIFPLIRRKKGQAVTFRVCGFKCPASIRALDGHAGVVVNSDVEDLLPLYDRAALVVAPLRAGGGTRLKILEAFSYGRPVVSSTIGAEGLAVTDGKDILLADSPERFAQACLDVLEQPELAGRLIAGAQDLNKARYSEEALVRAYDAGSTNGIKDSPRTIGAEAGE